MNIIVPMAGKGSRFSVAGYTFPKPLISVFQKPMIQVVVENLDLDATFIFVVLKEHLEKYHLKEFLSVISPNSKIIVLDEITQGAACTVLLAKELIDNDDSLLIANSDQFMKWNPTDFQSFIKNNNADGASINFFATHPKYSFAKVDCENNILEIKEKIPISNVATVGVYYWNKGKNFVYFAEQMIRKNIRVNNEFYVAPVYNEAIQEGKMIKSYMIEKSWCLGTPEDLLCFERNYNGKI